MNGGSTQDVKGVVVGVVKEIDAKNAAVKVDFPWMLPPLRSAWAPIATLMSGGKRGVYYMPELDDEVLIAFEHGKLEHPFVVGFLWNGMDPPPTDDPKARTIRSVNGHEIVLYDAAISKGDKGYVRVADAHGNTVELANGRITITGIGAVNIRAPSVTINGRLVAPVGPPI